VTPEGRTKKLIDTVLKRHGAYYHKPVQSGFGSPTLDYVGCYKGKFYAIEAKKPGAKPTPRQELTIKIMQAAGAKVFVIDGDVSELESWLIDHE